MMVKRAFPSGRSFGERLTGDWAAGRWWSTPARYGAALLGVAVATAVIAPLGGLHLANTSMLYIVVVLLTAVLLGRGPAIFSAIAAFLSFNFFLTEPRYTFFVGDPEEWLALVLFLVTAVVTGQLAAGQRRRAEEAEEYERQARVLYDIADAVAEPDLTVALQHVADRLRGELAAEGIYIEVGGAHGGRRTGATSADAPAVTAVLQGSDARPVHVLAAAGGGGHGRRWIRIAPPHGPRRAQTAPCRLWRVPIDGPNGQVGEIVVATRTDTSLDDGAARLLASVSRQLWVALERARLREEATQAEVLRRSDEAKSALLDAVSHDLRTPLASIIASAGSLRGDGVDWSDEEREAFAESIEQEARRLDRIVGNLLDVSRLRAGAIHADKAWYEPVALIREVVGRLESGAARRRHAIQLDLPDELPPLPLDYSKIDQVLTNLVENALKFSPDGSAIGVAAAMNGGALRVTVDDRGPGIDAALRKRIFEPFYRIGRSRRDGTGLGLAVANGLVQAHGGQIWAEPRAGGGTRFVFTVPREDGSS